MLTLAMLCKALGAGGLFTSRGFVPLFALLAALRAAALLHFDAGLYAIAGDLPGWFRSDAFLCIIGLLAAAEVFGNHGRETRQLMRMIDLYYKPVVAALATAGMISPADRRLVEALAGHADAQLTLQGVAPGLLAAVTFGSALGFGAVRKRLVDWFGEHDQDDDLGAQRLLALLEDVTSVLAPLLFLLLPLFIAVCAGALWLSLTLAVRALRRREARDQRICPCGRGNYRTALRCAACGAPNPTPAPVGLLGHASSGVASDLDRQRFALFAYRRCPSCAASLSGRSPAQVCGACARAVSEDPAFLHDYARWVDARAPGVLLLTALLGAVPIVGAIAGIVYARWTLVAPYRRYVSLVRSFALRWALRAAWFAVLALQLVPLAGALGLPALAYLSHRAYRAAFLQGLGPRVERAPELRSARAS